MLRNYAYSINIHTKRNKIGTRYALEPVLLSKVLSVSIHQFCNNLSYVHKQLKSIKVKLVLCMQKCNVVQNSIIF